MKKQIRIVAVLLGVFVLLFPGSAMADAASGGEYNYQDVDYYVVVDAPDGYVNLRYGPGMEYGIDEAIYNGETLHITATMDNYYDDLTWGQTNYYGDYGWVSLSQTSYIDPDPQPDPQYQDADQYNMVDNPDGYLNLRTGPGLNYDIITPISNGQILHVTMLCYNPDDGLTWGNTVYNGTSGWISISQTSSVLAPQPETPSTVPAPAVQSDYLVSDAFYQEDSNVYAIPMINMDSSDIRTLNQNIYNELYPEIQSALSDDPPSEQLITSTYTWNRNGDILSLIIYKGHAGPWHEYDVYNISISGQTLMNDAAVISSAGFTEEEYSQMASSAMLQSFYDSNPNTPSPDDEPAMAIYNQTLADTISSDNISSAMPFIHSNGDLSIIANIGLCFAQNSSSWKELDLVNPYVTDETQNFYVRVKGPSGTANLQTAPGTAGATIETINNGQKVFVTETVDNADDGSSWYATTYNGQKGWIRKSETY